MSKIVKLAPPIFELWVPCLNGRNSFWKVARTLPFVSNDSELLTELWFCGMGGPTSHTPSRLDVKLGTTAKKNICPRSSSYSDFIFIRASLKDLRQRHFATWRCVINYGVSRSSHRFLRNKNLIFQNFKNNTGIDINAK